MQSSCLRRLEFKVGGSTSADDEIKVNGANHQHSKVDRCCYPDQILSHYILLLS